MTRGPATVKKIEAHWALFRRLWAAFEKIAIPVIKRGASVFIEWPRGCKYWIQAKVVAFLKKYDFKTTELDGCMYGLVAKHGPKAGLPINKPWEIAYNKSSIADYLNLKCDHSHSHAPRS
eukprot:6754928-Heterocapsa_arctica.AAC.1